MKLENPYESPPAAQPIESVAPVSRWELPFKTLVLWSLALALNNVVIIWFHWGMTNGDARSGMALAEVILFLIGTLIVSNTLLSLPLIGGAFILALTQMMPYLQYLAIREAYKILVPIGLIDHVHTGSNLGNYPCRFQNAMGGFLFILMVGGIFMLASFAIGILLKLIIERFQKIPTAIPVEEKPNSNT